jgi:hypothetical protein
MRGLTPHASVLSVLSVRVCKNTFLCVYEYICSVYMCSCLRTCNCMGVSVYSYEDCMRGLTPHASVLKGRGSRVEAGKRGKGRARGVGTPLTALILFRSVL